MATYPLPFPPAMSRSSSSSTITLVPSTPPAHKLNFLEPALDIDAKPCLTLSAVVISKPITAGLSIVLSTLERKLRIVGLLATADSGCHMYADMTERACRASDVVFDRLDLTSPSSSTTGCSFHKVARAIEGLNADDSVDGLIVYFPVFGDERDAALRALISPRIDIEGVHPASLSRSYGHAPGSAEEAISDPVSAIVYPCTALAVVRALQHPRVGLYDPSRAMGQRFSGRTVTIINRSETVGRPLAGMLANDGARVYSVDIDSVEIYERAKNVTYSITPTDASLNSLLAVSDAVVSAVPGSSFKVDTAALRPGAACIDLSEHGNFLPDVRERAGVFAPRLGSVTILMLQLNALALRYHGETQRDHLAPRRLKPKGRAASRELREVQNEIRSSQDLREGVCARELDQRSETT